MRDKEERAQQQFVDDRIEVLAQHGALVEEPREQTIQSIGKAGENEQGKGELEVIVENREHQERRDTEAQECQQVRSRPKFVHRSTRPGWADLALRGFTNAILKQERGFRRHGCSDAVAAHAQARLLTLQRRGSSESFKYSCYRELT